MKTLISLAVQRTSITFAFLLFCVLATHSSIAQESTSKNEEVNHLPLFKKFLSISTQPEKPKVLNEMDILRFEGNDDGVMYYELKKEDRFKGISYVVKFDAKDKTFNYYRLRLHTLGKLETVKNLAETSYKVKFGKPEISENYGVEKSTYSAIKGEFKIEVIHRTWKTGPFGPGGVSGIHVTRIEQ